MKAFLFAILAILVLSLGPGPAHAVSPSAQLSVTVVPSQSMGRSGPSNCAGADLTPPTVASNAGFTTVVGCWDFTNMDMSAINCDHTNVQTSMSLWLGDPFFGNNVNASCGKNIYFATDQGVNALAAAFGPELANCGNPPDLPCTLGLVTSVGGSPADGPGFFAPLNGYFEITERMDPVGGSTNAAGFWEYNPAHTHLEKDYVEPNGTTGDVDFTTICWLANVGSFGCGGQVTHYTVADGMTGYHTYGYLAAGSADKTTLESTGYLDGAQIVSNSGGANPFFTNVTALVADPPGQHDGMFISETIPVGTDFSAVINYVRRVRVFSCANWQTTACFPGD